jgi:hypothetical protein
VNRRNLRLFGLRWRRLAMWVRVLREQAPTVKDWMTIARLALKEIVVRSRRRDGEAWRRLRVSEYRVCVRCPFHDPQIHRCLLCGCFMPYAIAVGKPCAAREENPQSTIGYGTGEPESADGSRLEA